MSTSPRVGSPTRPGSPGSGKIKFVCRWGGDFRQEGNGRCTYEGGETRLCTIPRIITYLQLVQKLRELTGSSSPAQNDMLLKYQLPGANDMEELVSLSNNEDLENFKEEHDALLKRMMASLQSQSGQRLRLFILPAQQARSRSLSDSGNALGIDIREALAQGHTGADRSSIAVAAAAAVQSSNGADGGPRLTPRRGDEGSGEGVVRRMHSSSSQHERNPSQSSVGTLQSNMSIDTTDGFDTGTPNRFSTGISPKTGLPSGRGAHFRTLSSPVGSDHMPSGRESDPMRRKSGSIVPPQEDNFHDDASTSGDDEPTNYSDTSSSDSEYERGNEMHTARSSRFAAETLSEVTAVLKRQKSGDGAPDYDPSADDETIEKCLNEVEAALNNGLNFKGKLNSGIQVAQIAIGPNHQRTDSNDSAGPMSPPLKKRVQITVPDAESKGGRPKMPLRLMVGSGMNTGEWTGSGRWQEVEEAVVDLPTTLQQIVSDDLEKVKELGRGQFGSVWLCRWLGVEVAVKELHTTSNSHSSAEMLQEAETLAFLRHPCVIGFYGVVVNQESPATVIEYVRGSSLRSGLTKLKQHKVLSKRVRAAIALQAARGMEYLHSRRVVHFDLKCDNLLCDLRDLMRPVVKIGDLGLSKKKAATFVSGNMRGTLPWMAPELFPSMPAAADPMCQEDRVTEKVDVFSFAVCMWEIWTLGEQPYPGMSLPEIFAGVMNGTLRPSRPADCPNEWMSLMEACWATQPSRRPTFTQIAAALDEFVQKCDKEKPPELPALH
ncbi:hypothetical protein WJX72_008076 [[Myrmecia] bisecta]|uniref:Protein kinase domain-containing protein n=1 Tax=[Myrmecia] bisecta TaxID=41462 RepID=A0AAW1P5S4_9CHLO